MKSAARTMVAIRPWQVGDLDRLARAEAYLSADTLHARFWSGVPGIPASYRRSIAARWPDRWDAVAAVDEDGLIGWAEYGLNAEPGEADVAFCLVDRARGHGLGKALLRAILFRATDAGLIRVYADIDPANRAARGAWRSVAAEFGGGPDASAARIRHRLELPHPIYGELALTASQALRPQR